MAFSLSVQGVEVVEVLEMLAATILIVSFVPIVSIPTELEYVTNRDMDSVRDAQSFRAFASLLVSLLLVLLSASLILEFTLLRFSLDWSRATKTFFKEHDLVLQVSTVGVVVVVDATAPTEQTVIRFHDINILDFYSTLIISFFLFFWLQGDILGGQGD